MGDGEKARAVHGRRNRQSPAARGRAGIREAGGMFSVFIGNPGIIRLINGRSQSVPQMTRAKLQPLKKIIQRNLQADVKFPEFRVIHAHGIETHFVDDLFYVEGVMRKKRDSPLGVVEAGGTRDQLQNLTVVFAAYAGVACHELFAIFESDSAYQLLFSSLRRLLIG